MPKVSVIIPVYNTEDYLRQCLDSVCSQTLDDIEIICVNDGSTDSCGDILAEYSKKDQRIKVLQQQNKGAGVARNTGLKAARAKYLYFLDPDDYIDKSLLARAVARIDKLQADVVVFESYELNAKTSQVRRMDWLFHKEWVPAQEPFSHKDMPGLIFNAFGSAVWNKLYRREFVTHHKLQFQDLRRANDVYFVSRSMVLAQKIVTLKVPLMYYRVGVETSLQSTNEQTPLDFYQALSALKQFLLDHGLYVDEVKKSYVNYALENAIYNLKSQKTYEGFRAILMGAFSKDSQLFSDGALAEAGIVHEHNRRILEEYNTLAGGSIEEALFGYAMTLKKGVDELWQSVQTLQETVTQRDSEAAAYKEAAAELQRIKSSLSWQVTKPLRLASFRARRVIGRLATWRDAPEWRPVS